MHDSRTWPVTAEQLLKQTEVLTDSGSWCLDLTRNQLKWSEQTYELFERYHRGNHVIHALATGR